MTRFLACLLILITSCFAGGGSDSLVATMNGWTLTLSSAAGSSATIEKRVGDRQLRAQIKFAHFWDYFLIAKALPQTAGTQKSPYCLMEDGDPPRISYLAAESARPIFELMLLNHRTEFTSHDAKLVEEELNKNPPLDPKLLPNLSQRSGQRMSKGAPPQNIKFQITRARIPRHLPIRDRTGLSASKGRHHPAQGQSAAIPWELS